MKAKKLENLLKSNASGKLEQIVQTAAEMQLLTTVLRDAVTPEIGEHLLAATVRENGELVVICASSAWASRLRFESKTLLSAAQKENFQPSSVRVTVTQS